MSSSGSDIAEGIAPEQPEHTQPAARKYEPMPWHRVRKEFIRQHQWNELAARLVKGSWRRQLQHEERAWSLDETESDEALEVPAGVSLDGALRCLVIPGDDLLDLRALWRDMRPWNCFIRYLGFNERQGSDQLGTRVHLANNDVKSLARVGSDSRVLADRFESIAQPQSLASRYLHDYGPYHIVNLDLCGSMFPNTAAPVKPFYDAVMRLLEYQFAKQTSPWLLFVTTMVEPAMADIAALCSLCGPARKNFDTHPDFVERMARLLPTSVFQSSDANVDITGLSEEQLTQLFGVALGKWLLAVCQSPSPKWSLSMRRSYRYGINEYKGAEMLSLAFELAPNFTPPVDPVGISQVKISAKRFPDESECAVKLAESVANICDVDTLLAADTDMKAALRDAQADLLAAAGHDRASYIQWVEGGEVITSC
jgi:hypothetical protein